MCYFLTGSLEKSLSDKGKLRAIEGRKATYPANCRKEGLPEKIL